MWIQLLCILLHRRCPSGERGQGMLEYAIISGIVIVGAIAALAVLSGALNQICSKIAATLSQY